MERAVDLECQSTDLLFSKINVFDMVENDIGFDVGGKDYSTLFILGNALLIINILYK